MEIFRYVLDRSFCRKLCLSHRLVHFHVNRSLGKMIGLLAQHTSRAVEVNRDYVQSQFFSDIERSTVETSYLAVGGAGASGNMAML